MAPRVPTLTLVALTSACLPTLPPAWLIDDPRVLAIRTDVIAAGPLAPPLADDPPDRTRSEALPGDTIRLTPIVADHDGLVDLAPVAPLWLRCRDDCLDDLAQMLENGALADGLDLCALRPKRRVCIAATGAPADVLVDPAWDFTGDDVRIGIPGIPFLMIAGSPAADLSADTCLERLLATPTGDLLDCFIVQRTLPIGPDGTAYEALPKKLDPPAVPPAEATPNHNPEPERFRVTIDGVAREALSGATLDVRPGATIRVELLVDPRDQETFLDIPGNLPTEEVLRGTWYATAPIYEGTTLPRDLDHTWTAPGTLAGRTVDEHIILRESTEGRGSAGRGSATHGWLRWRIGELDG